MKLESVKTFVLVVLIGASILLSFTLWSYQPNSERTIGGEVVDEDEEMTAGGATGESKKSLIKPADIIFHTPNGYYGFVEAVAQDMLYEKMQEWLLTDFEPNASEGNFATPHNGVELIFADAIPMEVINSLFNFAEENNYPDLDWSMNRIFISFIQESKSLHLEFISDEENRTATAVISGTDSYDQLWSEFNTLDEEKMQRYLAINEGPSAIYIPENPVTLPTYSITTTGINPTSFVNILFPNPSIVRETTSESIGETYFTDSRQMSVFQDSMRMEYVNHVVPSEEEKRLITEVDLLDNSIMNLNSHSGWGKLEKYRLEDIDLENARVKFQMYYKGYPVFNNSKLSTIQQGWTKKQNNMQLIDYERPLYRFESEVLKREVDDLASGESVIKYLEDTDVVLENIEDIKVGFELRYERDDPESEYIVLDPSWYKKENNTWQRIVFDELSNPKGVE